MFLVLSRTEYRRHVQSPSYVRQEGGVRRLFKLSAVTIADYCVVNVLFFHVLCRIFLSGLCHYPLSNIYYIFFVLFLLELSQFNCMWLKVCTSICELFILTMAKGHFNPFCLNVYGHRKS